MISVTQLLSVHRFCPDQVKWESLPRFCHYLAYQYDGEFIHTTDKKELITHKNSLLFLNKEDHYHVKMRLPGSFIVVSFQAEHMPESFCLDCSKAPQFAQLYHRLFSHRHLHIPGNEYHCISVLYEIFAQMQTMQEKVYLGSKKMQMVQPVYDYIREHYDDPALCTDALDTLCQTSSKYMRQLFRDAYGITPRQYLIQVRIQVAMQLLCGSDASVVQIARAVGMEDVYYFSRLFKKQTGVSPQTYRQMMLEHIPS